MFCLKNVSDSVLDASSYRDIWNQPLVWQSTGTHLSFRFLSEETIQAPTIAHYIYIGMLVPSVAQHVEVMKGDVEEVTAAYAAVFTGMAPPAPAEITAEEAAAAEQAAAALVAAEEAAAAEQAAAALVAAEEAAAVEAAAALVAAEEAAAAEAAAAEEGAAEAAVTADETPTVPSKKSKKS